MDVLSRYMAKEFGERRIRVNSVAPGAIRTDLAAAWTTSLNSSNADRHDRAWTSRRSRRRGLLVASLLSDDSRWVTLSASK